MTRTPLVPWRTISRRRVFAGGPIEEVAVETIELPDGRVIADYYQVKLADYVLIYAEMPDGTVPMLRQYRHGLRRVSLGFPGGAMEPGELPLAAAQRELREELGCSAAEWESLGGFGTNGNQGCNTAYLFRARGVQRIAEPASGDLEEAVIEYLDAEALLAEGRTDEVGLATHVTLLLLATERVRCSGSLHEHRDH
jgi:ADP-ribose pyrophosphatase